MPDLEFPVIYYPALYVHTNSRQSCAFPPYIVIVSVSVRYLCFAFCASCISGVIPEEEGASSLVVIPYGVGRHHHYLWIEEDRSVPIVHCLSVRTMSDMLRE